MTDKAPKTLAKPEEANAPQSAPPAKAPPQRDEFHGIGGLYTVINGVRQRVPEVPAKD